MSLTSISRHERKTYEKLADMLFPSTWLDRIQRKRYIGAIVIFEDQIGCWFDSHRGHYIAPAIIELAISFGFIIDPFAKYVLDDYDLASHDDKYPFESVIELCQDAIEWLNNGQEKRIRGQNFPPIIPADCSWDWNDGDFGLYRHEDLED